MITCRRAAELISHRLDTPLPLRERAGLGLHTGICWACRRFRRQLRLIDRVARDLLPAVPVGEPGAALSDGARDRLKFLILNQLDHGP